MLSGCPDCGGNTFQFRPAGAPASEPPAEQERPSTGSATDPPAGTTPPTSGADPATASPSPPTDHRPETSGTGPATGDGPDPTAPWPDERDPDTTDDSEIIDADARRDAEDGAQASARGDVATSDELAAGALGPTEAAEAAPTDAESPPPRTGPRPESEGRMVSEPGDENPDVEELRRQLNDQFESIKIVEPGQYELNLMELYNREEYIIALQENGRYVIQVPENWIGDRDGE
jgi:predicted  nucleic acid-binding Zn-ribbon protein